MSGVVGGGAGNSQSGMCMQVGVGDGEMGRTDLVMRRHVSAGFVVVTSSGGDEKLAEKEGISLSSTPPPSQNNFGDTMQIFSHSPPLIGQRIPFGETSLAPTSL